MIWCILFRKRFAAHLTGRPSEHPERAAVYGHPHSPRDILLSRRRMMPLGTHDMDKFTTITVEQRDAIEILSLNRPDALNAVTPAMADELITYFSGLHDRLTRGSSFFAATGGRFA